MREEHLARKRLARLRDDEQIIPVARDELFEHDAAARHVAQLAARDFGAAARLREKVLRAAVVGSRVDYVRVRVAREPFVEEREPLLASVPFADGFAQPLERVTAGVRVPDVDVSRLF